MQISTVFKWINIIETATAPVHDPDLLLSCKEKKVPAGLHVVAMNPNELKTRIDEGYQFIAYSIDSVILRSGIEL